LRRPLAALALALAACTSNTVRTVTAPPSALLDPSQPRTPPVVTLTAAGVSPVASHLDHPVTVQFVNRDAVAHRPEAAPEVGNGDCPEMAQAGTIAPGATGAVTIERAGSICSFRDGLQPGNLAFKGVLVVH
jgi:glucose/arabinose dehydrogenase